MQIPTWEQLSAVFAASGDEQAQAVREALLQQYSEFDDYPATSSVDNYVDALITIYGYFLDYKEGTFSIVEWLEDKLGDTFTAEFDYDDDTVKVHFGDRVIVLSHHSMGMDGFAQDLAKLEQLMKGRYLFLYRRPGEGGVNDTVELLLVPTKHWQRAAQRYGQAQVSAYFRRCVNKESIWDELYRCKTRIFLWLVLPVIVVFSLYVAWGTLKSDTPPPQPKGCENVDRAYNDQSEQVAAIMRYQMRKKLGCDGR
ncbi:hypothetical protein J5069_06055 [Candidatus Symbiopectobacterium sp. NZEC127]|uniref:hypothetical protein n=1 Tax=Candidatus Symbiopectobacterium sp. NZEC127 TaxID=2820472 RepID=UPI002225F49A|nr:hypothetical protein [Candidatus Symbiopectobacterium sp. NZEC127]MCW2485459.1 hypothetical protein [Candidatus Symbiopectobacterium sp. NZEC127]